MRKRDLTGQDWQIHAVDDHPKDDNERAIRLQESVTLAAEPGDHGRLEYALYMLIQTVSTYKAHPSPSNTAKLYAELARAKESLGDYKP